MWSRIKFAECSEWAPYAAFFLTFAVFVILVARAVMMRKAKARRMARLPLEEQPGDAPPPEDRPDEHSEKNA